MKYAVIKIKGRQYKVSEADTLVVSKVDKNDVKADVLLYVDGEVVKIGKPYLKTNKVGLKVVEEELKGEECN